MAATIEGVEQGCPDGAVMCLVVREGTLDNVPAGHDVSITFINGGESIHNLFVTTQGREDAAHTDTPASAAIASGSPEVEGGESEQFTVQVPADATGLYLWCDISGHEQLGMWMTVRTGPAEGQTSSSPPSGQTSTSSTPSGDGADDTRGSPVPVGLAALAIALAALVASRPDRPRR